MRSEDNKRIAKNTLFLYFRMLLTIVVNFYTVRVVWRVLGVDDYGIYNVVGGIVAMFAFLKTAMVASSQRFTSFELGRGDLDKLNRVFCISLKVHFLLAITVFLLTETIGIWFLNEKLNIPYDRMVAANWVYQCSIISLLVSIVSVPYDSCIVAHEHMKVYGYFGIIEVSLRLLMAFLLMAIGGDKLIIYSILMLGVALLMRLLSQFYCRKHFEECSYRNMSDKKLLRDMFSFSGWSFIGNFGFSVRSQGLNIIINMFFNVAVNAAKGIAEQIGAVVYGFAYNFQMALNPQITKKYASGDKSGMTELIFSGCKYSAILMMFIVVPLFFSADLFLHLWLGDVARYTVGFLQLILVTCLIDSMVGPITTGIQATGNIKKFQIIISIIMISNLPLAWLWLKIYSNPYVSSFIAIITSAIALAVRLRLLHQLVEFSYLVFIRHTLARIVPILVVVSVPSWIIYSKMPRTLCGLICYCIITTVIILICSYIIGLSAVEKKHVLQIIKNSLKFLSK